MTRSLALAARMATALVLAASARADEQEIPLSEVPKVALKAAAAAVPKAKWTSATRDDEGGVVTYDLEGTDAKGRAVTVTVTADGKVEEVETEIPLKEVPAEVKKAVKAKYPTFKASTAYEIRKQGKVTGYELDGKRPTDKEEITLIVSPDGRTIETDEE